MKASVTFLCLLFFSTLLADADICGIELMQGKYGAFAHGDRVEFSFDYSHDEASGIRIFGRPYTNGSLTSGYGAHGSGAYTDPNGVATGWFTINSGVRTVDEIRVRVTNADQSEVLREFWIPVEYHFGENGVFDFDFSAEDKMASFLHGDQVSINFDYNVTWAQGARIFIRPFTDGALTPGYGASGSPIYNGEGSATANLTINSGNNVRVEYLRVRMVNPDQTILLAEFFVPVNWYWSSVAIDDFVLAGPVFPANGENVTVSFDYSTTQASGVRIFPRPFTNGSLTPNYGACGSPIFSGTGSDDCNFSISATNQRVDHIRFLATSPDQSETYLEVYFPVNRYFGEFPLRSVVTCPPAPARLMPGERVNITTNYINNTDGDTRMFPRPVTEGSLTSGYSASGSPAYPTGGGEADDFFTINGEAIVDQIRFRVTNSNQSTIHADYFLDRRYVFGESLLPTSAHSPNATENLDWSFGPNPMQEQATLRLQSPDRQQMQIQLYDAIGRPIRTWNNFSLNAGVSQQITINAEELGLTNGIYFLSVRGSAYYLTETIVVSR